MDREAMGGESEDNLYKVAKSHINEDMAIDEIESLEKDYSEARSTSLRSHTHVKNTTNNIGSKIKTNVGNRIKKGDRKFKFILILILGIFALAVAGFLTVQSNATLAANKYKNAYNDYLDNVYNELSKLDQPVSTTISNIQKMNKAKLDVVMFGWINFSYAQAEEKQTEINNNVAESLKILQSNQAFNSFYENYVSQQNIINSLGDSMVDSTSVSTKIEFYSKAHDEYQALEKNVEKANLPVELQTSQNIIKTELQKVVGDMTYLSNALSSGNNGDYSKYSLAYSNSEDTIANEFIKINVYKAGITNQVKQLAGSFKDFSQEIKK